MNENKLLIRKASKQGLMITSFLFFIIIYIYLLIYEEPLNYLSDLLNLELRVKDFIKLKVHIFEELLSTIILIFAILLYCLLVTTHNFKVTKYYFDELKDSIIKSDVKVHTVYLILFLTTAFINLIPYGVKGLLLIFLSWIWLIYFVLKYCLYKGKKKEILNIINEVRSSKNIFKNLIYITQFIFISILFKPILLINIVIYNLKFKKTKNEAKIFICSAVSSLFIILLNKELPIVVFALLQFIINYLMLIIVSSLKHIVKMIKIEYVSASLDKQLNINEYITELILKSLSKKERDEFGNSIQISKIKNIYQFDKTSSFERYLKELRMIDESFKEMIMKNYVNMIIDYNESSKRLGNLIKKRNLTNFFAGLYMILLSFIFMFMVQYLDMKEAQVNSILKIAFCLFFLRLIMRSIEIGYAFYFDIRPEVKIKKTNLSNNVRTRLVVSSLVEITLISSVLYIITKFIAFKEWNLPDIFLIYLQNIQYAFSVAFFNVSFPFDFLEALYNPLDVDYWSLNTSTRFVHLIQIIISIILISLSITSYGSSIQRILSYNLILENDEFIILEIDKKNNNSKKLFKSKSIEELNNSVLLSWKNNLIGDNQYLELLDLINIYARKI